MYTQIFVCFTIGLLIGFLSLSLVLLNQNQNEFFEEFFEDSDIGFIEETVEIQVPKILCVILTSPKYHSLKAIHVRSTWGKHCDKLIFMSAKTDTNIGAIGFNVVDDHNHLWSKVKEMFYYVHENFIDDYDWVFKGDDDSFAILENMRYFLSSYSPQDPVYFGHRFQTKVHKYGYFSGGSGYVMSNAAVRLFTEKILTNSSFCRVSKDTGSEDFNMGECLDLAGVYPGDSRDPLKRDRFLPFVPVQHLFPSRDPKFWYWSYNYYKTPEGLDCCSNYTISTHYIKPKLMYTLYFLTYHLHLFGVKRAFPPYQRHLKFSDIVRAAENDKIVLDAIMHP